MVNSFNACNSPDQKLNYQLIILQKKKKIKQEIPYVYQSICN